MDFPEYDYRTGRPGKVTWCGWVSQSRLSRSGDAPRNALWFGQPLNRLLPHRCTSPSRPCRWSRPGVRRLCGPPRRAALPAANAGGSAPWCPRTATPVHHPDLATEATYKSFVAGAPDCEYKPSVNSHSGGLVLAALLSAETRRRIAVM